MLTTVNGLAVLVYNVDGKYYATDEACPHAQGLSAGKLEGRSSRACCTVRADIANGAAPVRWLAAEDVSRHGRRRDWAGERHVTDYRQAPTLTVHTHSRYT